MNVTEDQKIILSSVKFEEINTLDKFATVANNRMVIWRKLHNEERYLHGEDPSDTFTCPQPNAVTDTGFPACFCKKDEVFKVDSTEYNDRVIIHHLKKVQFIDTLND